MKIALIHDYLTVFGGAEKTFKALSGMFSEAEVYTLFYDKKIKDKFFIGKDIKTSFLQKLPAFLRKNYKLISLLFPIAAESLDFREFDVVISSSHSFVKGIITRPKTIHICYCYSPTRYLWDKSKTNSFLHYLRIWDRQASERVDYFIACSKTVQQRIKKYYKRDSIVIYPPVQFPHPYQAFGGQAISNNEFYLIVSQLRKYKRIDLAVEAFNKLGLNLVIIGEGPEKKKLEKMAKKNIKFLGWQSDEKLNKYYKDCTAFIFSGEDDFGIAPVEAMSYGKPVLALRKGGVTETVIEGKTGEFFDFENTAVLCDGVRRLRANFKSYDPKFISQHAQKFSKERFKKEILEFVNQFAGGN